MSEQQVSGERVIDAPPKKIFDLLADPSRHSEIDGSGSVKGARGSAERLSLGSRFGMNMRIGVPYPIRNEVVEFEEGSRIAWRHFGHHVWRYELEPVNGGKTRVKETFDYAGARSPRILELMKAPEHNKKAIDATLERLQQAVTS